MKRRAFNIQTSLLTLSVVTSFVLAACGGGDPAATTSVASNQLYSQTNATANAIVHMLRASDGSLTVANSMATGGKGSNGAPSAGGAALAANSLASQFAVTISTDNKTLFAINAGDNSISSFSIDSSSGNLTLLKNSATTGSFPNSLTYSNGYVYASFVNNPRVIGYKVDADGSLTSVGEYQLPANYVPTQVKASPNGAFLLVGSKSSSIVSFPVNSNGSLGGSVVNSTSINVPFAGVFLSNTIYITADVEKASLSSYTLSANGTLTAITQSVLATGQGASCWLSITPNGKWAYVGNGSGSISVYSISATGALTLVNATASNEALGVAGDSWISADGKHLYSTFLKDGSVIAYSIDDTTGAITKVGNKVQVTPVNSPTSSTMQGLVGI